MCGLLSLDYWWVRLMQLFSLLDFRCGWEFVRDLEQAFSRSHSESQAI